MKVIILAKEKMKPLKLEYNERLQMDVLMAFKFDDEWSKDMSIVGMAMLPIDPKIFAYIALRARFRT